MKLGDIILHFAIELLQLTVFACQLLGQDLFVFDCDEVIFNAALWLLCT